MDFGRRAVLAARQTLVSRILDLEKDDIYKKYKDRVGEIVGAEVYQIWKKEILCLDDEGNEVPEIFDGLITIKRIEREPGERAKVAVESYDDRIDPVGACVGMKGSRIHGIVRELKNENIDIINYTDNQQLLIQRGSPKKFQRQLVKAD